MYYKESKLILKKIKEAKKILINCHRGPDLDAVGSALALRSVLVNLKKKVEVVCPSEKIYDELGFLVGYESIKKGVNYSKLQYEDFDLFICIDSSTWSMVTNSKNSKVPDIPLVVIDHHYTNEKYGIINLVDKEASSAAEVLFKFFEDCNLEIDKNASTALLTGIIGDTGIFKYPNTSSEVFEISSKLIKLGAQRDLIISEVYRSLGFNLIKFWGETLNRVKLEKEYRFIYSAVPFEIYEQLGMPANAKETACDLFAQTVEGTDFGFMALETEKNKISISFRARADFDTSKIALELGGGGHKAASGGKVEGLSFAEGLEKILEVVRKHAKKHN